MSWRERLDQASASVRRAKSLAEVEVQRKLAERGVQMPEHALDRVRDQVRIQAREMREVASEKLRERGHDVAQAKPLVLRDGTIYIPPKDEK